MTDADDQPEPPMPRMLGDRLLVRRDESKLAKGPIEHTEKTLTESRPLEGTVLAIAPAVLARNDDDDKQPLNVGDHIKYAAYASDTTIEVNGEELVVLVIDDVLAIDD